MALRDRIAQLNQAIAERDGETGVQIIRAIEAEGHPEVAKKLQVEIIAAAVRAAGNQKKS